MKYNYKTNGTCSREIEFDIDGNVIKNIKFEGGCNGNLKALSRAINGKTVEEIEKLFLGLTCGSKSTSCSDQLAKAVRKAFEENKKTKRISI